MLKLLGRKTSGNVQKVMFLLDEIGAEYTRKDYGRKFGNTKTPDYLAMNPTGKVPTLVDGDLVIWESNTILRYLAATRAPTLAGATPAEATRIGRWMDFLLAAINPGYLAAFKGSKLAPDARPDGFGAQIADLHANMAIIDTHLQGKDHVALGKLTIADIALAPIIGRCLNFPLERPSMPALEAWHQAIASRAAYQTATS